jgi:uracil-DNA glycosylase family 4
MRHLAPELLVDVGVFADGSGGFRRANPLMSFGIARPPVDVRRQDDRNARTESSDGRARIVTVQDAGSRRVELERRQEAWRSCERCALAPTRTQVVVGSGDLDADLMFVGEAPGFHEDKQGVPFVGQAGKLLETLLGEIGLTRERVYIANVLKCRPPGNRDPQPDEIEACQGYLYTQIQLIRPSVICTLGNFSTKLLTGSPLGITRVRGRPQPHTFGAVDVQLYPIYHPAAALYTPAMLEMLRSDFSRLPELLRGAPAPAAGAPEPEPVATAAPAEPAEAQLSFQF